MPWLDRIASFLETAEDRLGRHAGFLAGWLALLWAVEGIDAVTGRHLDQWGIRPHEARGLAGVVLAPFLHAGFGHLATNSFTLMALAWLTLITGWKRFWIVTALTTLGGGLALWLTGREGTIHLGCSALSFGYLGYLMAYGAWRRSLPWLTVSAGLALLYGSLLSGLWTGGTGSGSPQLSWEGHLFGFLFGILGAAVRISESSAPGGVQTVRSGERETRDGSK